jgi:hypothetical protein
MGLRPQTFYGIADSPVGLAAYFLDHDARSYELIARVFQGQAEGLTRDDILDNITITWLTNTALSGARLYWEHWGKLGNAWLTRHINSIPCSARRRCQSAAYRLDCPG